MYEGQERRREDEDHDLIVEMHAVLLEFKKNFEKHEENDNVHFGRLYSSTGHLKWYIAVGIGILITLKFFLK